MSLTRDELSTILLFNVVNDEWVREVHRFTSQRKKRLSFIIFRNKNNRKLFSLEEFKEELENVDVLVDRKFKTAYDHDIVSNKVGANKAARRAAKDWMMKVNVADTSQEEIKFEPPKFKEVAQDASKTSKPSIQAVGVAVAAQLAKVAAAAKAAEKAAEEAVVAASDELVYDADAPLISNNQDIIKEEKIIHPETPQLDVKYKEDIKEEDNLPTFEDANLSEESDNNGAEVSEIEEDGKSILSPHLKPGTDTLAVNSKTAKYISNVYKTIVDDNVSDKEDKDFKETNIHSDDEKEDILSAENQEMDIVLKEKACIEQEDEESLSDSPPKDSEELNSMLSEKESSDSNTQSGDIDQDSDDKEYTKIVEDACEENTLEKVTSVLLDITEINNEIAKEDTLMSEVKELVDFNEEIIDSPIETINEVEQSQTTDSLPAFAGEDTAIISSGVDMDTQNIILPVESEILQTSLADNSCDSKIENNNLLKEINIYVDTKDTSNVREDIVFDEKACSADDKGQSLSESSDKDSMESISASSDPNSFDSTSESDESGNESDDEEDVNIEGESGIETVSEEDLLVQPKLEENIETIVESIKVEEEPLKVSETGLANLSEESNALLFETAPTEEVPDKKSICPDIFEKDIVVSTSDISTNYIESEQDSNNDDDVTQEDNLLLESEKELESLVPPETSKDNVDPVILKETEKESHTKTNDPIRYEAAEDTNCNEATKENEVVQILTEDLLKEPKTDDKSVEENLLMTGKESQTKTNDPIKYEAAEDTKCNEATKENEVFQIPTEDLLKEPKTDEKTSSTVEETLPLVNVLQQFLLDQKSVTSEEEFLHKDTIECLDDSSKDHDESRISSISEEVPKTEEESITEKAVTKIKKVITKAMAKENPISEESKAKEKINPKGTSIPLPKDMKIDSKLSEEDTPSQIQKTNISKKVTGIPVQTEKNIKIKKNVEIKIVEELNVPSKEIGEKSEKEPLLANLDVLPASSEKLGLNEPICRVKKVEETSEVILNTDKESDESGLDVDSEEDSDGGEESSDDFNDSDTNEKITSAKK